MVHEINALTLTVCSSPHLNPMQRVRYVLLNDTRTTMKTTAETFLALVKTVAISAERARGFTSSTIMTE